MTQEQKLQMVLVETTYIDYESPIVIRGEVVGYEVKSVMKQVGTLPETDIVKE